MENFWKSVETRWNFIKKNKYFPLLCFAAGAIFSLIVFQIFATMNSAPNRTFAANQLAIEVENGTLSNNAILYTDAGTSNGKYVQLGSEPAPTSAITLSPSNSPSTTLSTTVSPAPSGTSCNVSDKLVNECRPWLGAAAANYPQATSGIKEQILYHEQRIGRKVDIVHTYHGIGSKSLSDTDKFFATRDNTYLFINWKPATKWSDATGANTSVNTTIDEMANSIKSLGSKKLFLTLHAEPENDVTGGGTCSSYKGTNGTASQFKEMWKNVHDRFNAAGATNVVWVITYLNDASSNCLANALYPGDNLVDWVVFNAYAQGDETFTSKVSNMYDFLNSNSNSSHNYKTKPWGIVEWGLTNASADQKSNFYTQVKTALDNNTYPNLKAYMAFDGKGANSTDYRIAYDKDGKYTDSLQEKYNAFARDEQMTK